MTPDKRIIVVGGGMAGLTTANFLAKRGADVLLIEKNEKCGGLVNSFTRDGFLFDGGIRAIENAGMIKPMLEELKIDLQLKKSDISLGIEDKIISADKDDSVYDYERLLKELYPDSHDDIDRVIKVIINMREHMNVLFGNKSPFFKNPDRKWTYYFTTLPAWLLKLIGTFFAINRMKVPVEEFLRKIISNRSLDDMISQHFFKGTPAFFAMSYFALYTDYYYPEGGVGQLTAMLEEKLIERGGSVLKKTDITCVDPVRKVLTDQNGNSYTYEKMIWAADLKQLYRILDLKDLDKALRQKVEDEKAKVLACKGAESVFTLFMATEIDPESLRKVSHGHFFYTPSRRGLGSLQRGDLQKMLDKWKELSREEILAWIDDFCRYNTYEISVPVLSEPKAAPKGKSGIIVSLLMDYELVRNINEDGWYKEFNTYMAERIIENLNKTIYPGIDEKILFKFTASPLSIEKQVRSSEGAIVGWSFEKPVPVEGGMLNMKNSVKTTIPDVYKAGQWSVSPAGLPTCILTAKLASDLIIKEGR